MKWIDKKLPKWANEGKKLIKEWQKEQKELKEKTKQIKLDLL